MEYDDYISGSDTSTIEDDDIYEIKDDPPTVDIKPETKQKITKKQELELKKKEEINKKINTLKEARARALDKTKNKRTNKIYNKKMDEEIINYPNDDLNNNISLEIDKEIKPKAKKSKLKVVEEEDPDDTSEEVLVIKKKKPKPKERIIELKDDLEDDKKNNLSNEQLLEILEKRFNLKGGDIVNNNSSLEKINKKIKTPKINNKKQPPKPKERKTQNKKGAKVNFNNDKVNNDLSDYEDYYDEYEDPYITEYKKQTTPKPYISRTPHDVISILRGF
jgi:hypothetical protein